MTLDSAAESFYEHLASVRKTDVTIYTYRKELNSFNKYLCKEYNRPVYIEDLTGRDIEKYMNYKQESDISMYGIITAFKAFINYAYTKGYIKVNISKQIKQVKRRVKERTYLSTEELERLFECINHGVVKAAVLTLYYAGLRINECEGLKLNDVDFDNNKIIIREDKENNTRIIPINHKLRAELLNYIENNRVDKNTDYFFSTRTGKLSDNYVNLILREAIKKAKIDRVVTCHILRHSFASNLVLKGIDLNKVKRLMGHKSIETTSIYLHANKEELKKAVRLLG